MTLKPRPTGSGGLRLEVHHFSRLVVEAFPGATKMRRYRGGAIDISGSPRLWLAIAHSDDKRGVGKGPGAPSSPSLHWSVGSPISGISCVMPSPGMAKPPPFGLARKAA